MKLRPCEYNLKVNNVSNKDISSVEGWCSTWFIPITNMYVHTWYTCLPIALILHRYGNVVVKSVGLAK